MDPQTLFTTDFWYMAPTLSAITVFIAGLINGKFNITEGIWPQVVAWVTGSVLSVAAWFFGLVTVGNPVWLAVIMLCVVVGLSSNGIYDIPTIKAFIDKLFSKEQKQE